MEKEAPLRRDVRSLGKLLGEVLQEQGGTELFETVETLRRLAIEYRDSGEGEGEEEKKRRRGEDTRRRGFIPHSGRPPAGKDTSLIPFQHPTP